MSEFDASKLEVNFMREGTILRPNIPVLTITGPMGYISTFEATISSMFNYSSLLAINAFRFVKMAEPVPIVELGLRRSYGVHGGYLASLYRS